MEMTLVQRAVAFVAIICLLLLVCFAFWAADPLRLTTLSGEYTERTINSPGAAGDFGFLTLIQVFDGR